MSSNDESSNIEASTCNDEIMHQNQKDFEDINANEFAHENDEDPKSNRDSNEATNTNGNHSNEPSNTFRPRQPFKAQTEEDKYENQSLLIIYLYYN